MKASYAFVKSRAEARPRIQEAMAAKVFARAREEGHTRLRIGQHADQAEAAAEHAQELVILEMRYCPSERERREMADERKADAFDRLFEEHMDQQIERAFGGL